MASIDRIFAGWQRLKRAISRRGRERELDEELRFHVDMQTEENLRLGMTPEEARRRALVLFGGVEGHREACRDVSRLRPLENFLADTRFAIRHFRRTPMTSATMLLVLVLGLGVNAALFSAVQSTLTLPPEGVARDPGLVRVRGIQHASRFGSTARRMTGAEVREYADRDELFSAVAAWTDATAVLEPRSPDEWTVPVRAIYVTGNYFGVLGIAPAMGGTLLAAEGTGDGSVALAAVISQELWDRRFGRALDAVGQTLRVNGFPIEVVGVAPPGFEGIDPSGDPVLWLPLSARGVIEGPSEIEPEGEPAIFNVVARLRAGVTPLEATPTVAAIGARAPMRMFGDEAMQSSADVVPLLRDNANVGADGRLAEVVLLFGAVTLLILLVTCTNVSGLLVGVALARRREIAVRLSLGAGRWRIVRQLLTESMLLSLVAAMLAHFLLMALTGAIRRRFPDVDFVLDWQSVLFASGLALIAAVGFGLSPALHASRMAVGEVLKDAGAAVSAPRSWLLRALVVIQVALTQPLLVGLGAFVLLAGGELGSRPSREVYERIASFSFQLFAGNPTVEGRRQEMERVAERLRAMPGVIAVAPDDNGYSPMKVTVPVEDRITGVRYTVPLQLRAELTLPGYLEVLDIPVLRGRGFLPHDWEQDRSAVIIGADLAKTLWGEADPIGRRLRDVGSAGDPADYTVVGVVDEDVAAMTEMGEPRVLLAADIVSRTLLVRTRGAAAQMVPRLRAVASAEAPGAPITEAATLAALEAADRSAILRMSGVAAVGGLLALLLSAIGLYGVVSTTVGQGMREIGLRTALGARPQQVAGHFFAIGVRVAALGLVIGLPMGLLALKLFALRVGMPQVSSLTLAALVAAGTLGIAALAAWVPARRAAGADPLIALRSE